MTTAAPAAEGVYVLVEVIDVTNQLVDVVAVTKLCHTLKRNRAFLIFSLTFSTALLNDPLDP